MSKKRLTIVYHSLSGRNERLALSVYDGASMEKELICSLKRSFEADSDDIINSDGLVLVGPETIGNVSGGIKAFLDRVFYPVDRAGKAGLPYALLMSTGNDGSQSIKHIEKIMQGLRARKIQDVVLCYGEPDDKTLEQASELGFAFASGLTMGLY